MPDLLQALQSNDYGFLSIVSELWALELQAVDTTSAVEYLIGNLSKPDLVQEIYEVLPGDAKKALDDLISNRGRMLWALFTRKHGDLRIMGRGRRDREKPHFEPISATEILWYRALISKAFLNLDGEPQEYAYVPDEIYKVLKQRDYSDLTPLGRPATPAEAAVVIPASDQILDHTCTLLAALRSNISRLRFSHANWPYPIDTLESLLQAAGLIKNQLPDPDLTKRFLENTRAESLAFLVNKWQASPDFIELRLIPGLKFEGQWENNPLTARNRFIEFFSSVPERKWWNINAFIAAVKETYPDFQRPAGDYDSWFILNNQTNAYLRGFCSWDEVDGAYLRFMITGPLYWFGLVELARPNKTTNLSAFRSSAWSQALWHGSPPQGLSEEDQPLKLFSDGRLIVNKLTSRAARYQISRFCSWEKETLDGYTYRITPRTLTSAKNQDLRVPMLITLLKRYTSTPVPPAVLRALENWEKSGTLAGIKPAVILVIKDPEAKLTLQKSNANKFIIEQYNDTTFSIDPKQAGRIRDVLAEAGFLCDINEDLGG